MTTFLTNTDIEIHSTNGTIKLNSIDFSDIAYIETENGDVTADLDDHGDNYTFDISNVNKKIVLNMAMLTKRKINNLWKWRQTVYCGYD